MRCSLLRKPRGLPGSQLLCVENTMWRHCMPGRGMGISPDPGFDPTAFRLWASLFDATPTAERLWDRTRLKLPQKPQVVRPELPNVVDRMLEHRDALRTHAECEAAMLGRIVAAV